MSDLFTSCRVFYCAKKSFVKEREMEEPPPPEDQHWFRGMLCCRCGVNMRDAVLKKAQSPFSTERECTPPPLWSRPDMVVATPQIRNDTFIEELIPMAGGRASSSFVPPYHLIPAVATSAIAMRFHKGVVSRGDKAWNAQSDNQDVLDNREFLMDRLGHTVHHLYTLMNKILEGDYEGLAKDDDAGAILFGGAFAACAVDRMIKKHKAEMTGDAK